MTHYESSILPGLAGRTVNAIRDPEAWGDVLEHILENTDFCGAIITLRDKKTCQIVNDRDLESKFHSPLIRGFTTEAVVYYLTELRTIDPWAEYQRFNYPFRPTIMSRVCPPEGQSGQRFFEWLNNLGMEDTVVFELDRMAGYWTACNLFLPNRDTETGSRARAFAEAHFEMLRDAWQTSQAVQKSRQTELALLDHLNDAGKPYCLVGPNGEFQRGNGMFDDMVNEDVIRISGPAKKLSFSKGVKVIGLEGWEDHTLMRHDGPDTSCRVNARPIEPDPRFAEKREKMWLLSVTGFDTSPQRGAPERYDLRDLTAQETKMFQAVVHGKSVSSAGDMIGVRRSRAFEIWGSVKEKLNITNAHQIRQQQPAE
ncbi:MAG: hypothetical protein OIF48_05380 [Silicimonas sp.]|nr:hypothetical protein [Silicimonas sp.]